MSDRFEIKEEAVIIMNAINQYHTKHLFVFSATGCRVVGAGISEGKLYQLRHFAKQGVKVRLK